jgi:P27 family predicted phage terminase small subunit
MAKQERSKKSTISNTVNTFQSANDLPQPTEHLDERELTYFNRVMKSREVSSWSDHDLAIATELAQSHVMYQDCITDVKENGRSILNERGTPVANPAAAMMNQLSSTVRAFSATLGLSASQRGLAGGKQDGRNKAEQFARKVIQKASEDSLLA